MAACSEAMREHPLICLARCYPQLLLPIAEETRNSEAYKNTVLRGGELEGTPDFSLNPGDTLTPFVTPAGEVQVLFLQDRADFVHAIQALAYRCAPRPVPASMGASSLSGLINWEKIHAHMASYLAAGGEDEDAEFARFTADKSNYLDCLIVLSAGPYSAVSAEAMGMDEKEWIDRSVTIRKFHELTHFISRHRYPANQDAIRDEILADMDGLIAAFGFYDTAAAARFLGIEGESYREGGRLQNYCTREELPQTIERARTLIARFAQEVEPRRGEDVFAILCALEEARVGLPDAAVAPASGTVSPVRPEK